MSAVACVCRGSRLWLPHSAQPHLAPSRLRTSGGPGRSAEQVHLAQVAPVRLQLPPEAVDAREQVDLLLGVDMHGEVGGLELTTQMLT